MASTIKVDNVQNQPGTNIINKCSVTTTIGAGAGETIKACAATVTLGRCGGTVALASGATQTGFGRTGTVDWQTGSIKTSTFTAANGEGYFADTSGGAFTMNLPVGVVGNIVSVSDYTRTFQTYNLTVSPNGSEKIGGAAAVAPLKTEGQSVTFVYVDATEGWINVQDSTSAVQGRIVTPYVLATGGTPACGLTIGDYKTHIFTGPGTLCVSNEGTPAGSTTVDYFVVAGGGAGGLNSSAAGAGAGGFRLTNSVGGIPAPCMSPLAGPAGLPVAAVGYPVTVGGGGAPTPGDFSGDGNISVFTGTSTITSAGGGGGRNNPGIGKAGGSGGGGKSGPTDTSGYPGGAGDTPATPIAQGFPGGAGYDGISYNTNAGAGGGAAAAGGNAGPGSSAPGGIGSFVADAFIGPTAPTYGTPGPTGSTRYFAGGGGGAADSPNANTWPGGAGGGGIGGGPTTPAPTRSGTLNSGGGGGAGAPCATATTGGSGIVMIRYKFQ